MRRSSCGESEGVIKVLTYFSEATYMEAGSLSGVYWAILSGQGLSSMVIGGRIKSGIPKSVGKVSFKQS